MVKKERLEMERLAAGVAKQADLEKIEGGRIERERHLEEQRQMAETIAKAERIEQE